MYQFERLRLPAFDTAERHANLLQAEADKSRVMLTTSCICTDGCLFIRKLCSRPGHARGEQILLLQCIDKAEVFDCLSVNFGVALTGCS